MPPPTTATSTCVTGRASTTGPRDCSCTKRASNCTCSRFVAGRMPCPRLKMWPVRPRARRSTSNAPRSRRSTGPSSRVGVEVALHREVVAHEVPPLVERYAPVEADDVAARLPHRRQQGGGAGAEVHHGHPGAADGVEDLPRVGQRELAVVLGGERAHPRVEDLHRLHARLDLRVQVVADDGGEGCPRAGARPRARRTSGPWCARSCSTGRPRWRTRRG